MRVAPRARPDRLRAREHHHAPRLHLTELHEELLRILQQRALEEAKREVLLEALQDHDVLAIHGEGGLAPLALLLHRQRGEDLSHRRDLRLPPRSYAISMQALSSTIGVTIFW